MKKEFRLIIIFCFCLNFVFGQVEVAGLILSAENSEPLKGVTIRSELYRIQTITNDAGEFFLNLPEENDKLIISSVGYKNKKVLFQGQEYLRIELEIEQFHIEEVVVSTGYQDFSVSENTGSYFRLGKELLDRSVSLNVIDRLEGVTSGLNFDRRFYGGAYGETPRLKLRGLSTIDGNQEPLIILNNFPYDYGLESIDPNTIESITILKDASAASIWGAQAGNGVIVIKTKGGEYNQSVTVEFSNKLTMGLRPDLYYDQSFLDSKEFLDIEYELFNRGYYVEHDGIVLSPFVEKLYSLKKENREIDANSAQKLIKEFGIYDIRDEATKFLYRHQFTQQYNASFQGGANKIKYFINWGHVHDQKNKINDYSKRYSLNTNATIGILRNFELSSNIGFVQYEKQISGMALSDIIPAVGKSIYPYARLKDENGEYLPVPKDHRLRFIENVKDGSMLDWGYFPLDEIKNNDFKNTSKDIRFDIGLKYTIFDGMNLDLKYQYYNQIANDKLDRSIDSYYVRNLINRYTQKDGVSAIPMGGILDENSVNGISNSGRAQLNYIKSFKSELRLMYLIGAEIRDIRRSSSGNRIYGFNKDILTSQEVDYVSWFDLSPYGSGKVPLSEWGMTGIQDRYVSYFANTALQLKDKYTLSGSIRKDASNLFGVKTNQKWVPLWSLGGSWDLSKEEFNLIDWLSYLRFRATYGYNGNINKSISAYTTALYLTDNLTGLNYAQVTTAPNPDLRWERVGVWNFGIDFSFNRNRVYGSIEYYNKNGRDLIGDVPLDPTTGFHRSRRYNYKLNYANIETRGWDFILNSRNLIGEFRWDTKILFSVVKDEVKSFLFENTNTANFLSEFNNNPVEGKPLYAVYSYPWNGLDSESGDPLVYSNGELGKDYATYIRNTTYEDLVYHGSAQPTYYGSMMNTFIWRNLSVSMNVLFKGGFYFRKGSINYGQLFNSWRGHQDFHERWKSPGDELKTDIPSLVYTVNSNRDLVYSKSEALVEKGDNMRLQDVQITYTLDNPKLRIPLSNLRLSLMAHNLGTLWKATSSKLDPDYPSSSILPPETFSFSINANF